jgi:selenocysteine lyase/cysteine desulfurase
VPYLNQAGTSWPKPQAVRAAVVDAMTVPPESWAERMEAHRREVARFFGAPPERLLLTPGCTSALAVAIADHDWAQGDRVIVSGMEHHALSRPAQKLAGLDVELVVIPRAGERPLDLDCLERELGRGGVRLVAMTAASNVTGELLPIESIARMAHEYGALCLIDGAQIAGWIPLEPLAMGIDLFTFAGHKGPQGPSGIGGLIVAPEVIMNSPAAVCALPGAGEQASCATIPGSCDVGSLDRVALAGLCAGLRWLAEPERANRLGDARILVDRLRAGLAEIPGIRFHGASEKRERMPTLALTIQGRDPSEIAAELAKVGVVTSAGMQCAPLTHGTLGTEAGGVLRMSVGPQNSEPDIESAIEALHSIVG